MKNKILMLFVIFAALFTIQVNAKQIYSSEKIVIDEQKDGSVFAAGEDIKVKSFIDGATFVVGENVEISSSQDSVFAIGEDIKLKNAYTKELFVVAKKIVIEMSEVRNLYVIGDDITVKSPISRNAYIKGNEIIIDTIVNGDLEIEAKKVKITKNAKIRGTLKYLKNTKITIEEDAMVKNKEIYNKSSKIKFTKKLIDGLVEFLISYASILLLGIIVLFLFKKHFAKLAKEELVAKNILKRMSTGLLLLVILPIISAILLVTIIGIPIACILLAVYILGIYLSIIPTAYYFAHKFLKNKVKNEYVILALGIIVIKLLELIPVIGGLIVFMSLCFGFGFIYKIRKKQIN